MDPSTAEAPVEGVPQGLIAEQIGGQKPEVQGVPPGLVAEPVHASPPDVSGVPPGLVSEPVAAPQPAPHAEAPAPVVTRPSILPPTARPTGTPTVATPQFLPGTEYKPPAPIAMPPSTRLTAPRGANFETPQAAADYEDTPAEDAAQRAGIRPDTPAPGPVSQGRQEPAAPVSGLPTGFSLGPAPAKYKHPNGQPMQDGELPPTPYDMVDHGEGPGITEHKKSAEDFRGAPLPWEQTAKGPDGNEVVYRRGRWVSPSTGEAVAGSSQMWSPAPAGTLEAAPKKGIFGRAWDAIRDLPYPSGDGTLGREMDRVANNVSQAAGTARNVASGVAEIPAALSANPVTGKSLLTRAVDMLDALDKKVPVFQAQSPEEHERYLISQGVPPDQAKRFKNIANGVDPLHEAIVAYWSADPERVAKIQDRGLSVSNVLLGMGGGARQVADGLTTPENLAIMYAIGEESVPRAIKMLASLGFAATQGRDAVREFNLGYDAYKKGDVITATQAWTAAPVDALFAFLTGAHLAGARGYEGAYGEHGVRVGGGPVQAEAGYRPAYREPGPTGSYSPEEGSRVVPGAPTFRARVGPVEIGTKQPAAAVAPEPVPPKELGDGGTGAGENVPRTTPGPGGPAAPAGEPPKPGEAQIGTVEPETGRPVLQQGTNPEAIQEQATEEHPEVKRYLRAAVSTVPGAKLAGARPEKDADRLEEKIDEEGQSPATARDYSGFRISVDSAADVAATIASLRQHFEVHGEQDNFDKGDQDHGFHSYTLNVRQPGSDVTHEVQILPKEVAEAANKDHGLYEKARDGDKDAAAELRARNDQHWQDFQARQGGNEAETKPQREHEFGTTHYAIPADSEAGKALDQTRDAVLDEDLAGPGKDVGGNHVTVRYGLQHDLTPQLRSFIEAQAPFDATLGPTAAFPPSKYSHGAAPLHAAIESPELTRLNKEIESHADFAPTKFDGYKPHATIAYVKPEAAQKYVGNQATTDKPFRVDSITVADGKGKEIDVPLKGAPERRRDEATRQRVAEMSPEEMRKTLLTSEKTGLPNRRAFEEAERQAPAAAVAMSDADGLKAFNDRFGYAAGDQLLEAKADALKAAGLEAYHDKGDEFLYRGQDEAALRAGLDRARRILRDRTIEVTTKDGTKRNFKGADFSYGTGIDTRGAEGALKEHKAGRTAAGERQRGELRGIAETRPEQSAVDQNSTAGGRAPARGEVGAVRTADLHFDPKRFQYKLNTDAGGTTNLLKGQRWNPDLAGVISVWRDPANDKLYVVNGHHRAQLAKENKVPTLNALHLPAETAEEARATAALQNIAEGRGTAVDAAKFFRDTGITVADLKDKGISLGEATAANGLALSRLDGRLFDKVVSGQLRQGRAIEIGNATDVPEQQDAILKLIERQEARGRRVSDDTVAELARMASRAGEHAETQQTLFGAVEMRRNLALEKAEISSFIREEIGKERRLFQTVADKGRAATLEKGSNRINAAENAKTAETAAQDQELYDRLSTRTGPIDDVLNRAAKELAEGKGNSNDIKRRAYSAARTALAEAYQRGETAGAAGPGAGAAGSQPVRADESKAGPAASAAGAPGAAPGVPGRPAGRIAKGDVVRLRDGSAGVVQYVTPSPSGLVRARVRLADGKMREAVKPADMRRVDRPAVDPNSEWIGVDLDKTLAHYTDFKGKENIGKPIREMVDRIKNILANGEEVDGHLVKDVRFFTARVADDPTGVARSAIEAWSQQHLGQVLPVTNIKDPKMVKLYDDRAAQVEPNTGQIVGEGNAENGSTRQTQASARGAGAPSGAPASRVAENPARVEAAPAPARDDRGPAADATVRGPDRESIQEPADRARTDGRRPDETAQATQARLVAKGRFQRELSAAEDRLSWDNAAKAEIKKTMVDGAPVHVMNAPGYEAIRKIAFPEDRFTGVFLASPDASRAIARIRSFESNVRVRPGMRPAAEALKSLALTLDQARDDDGSLLLVRGDGDSPTIREELFHRWYMRGGLYGSGTMEEIAAMPV